MPVTGRQKKAKPHHVRSAYWQAPTHPIPTKSETFKQFLERLVGVNDEFYFMLIAAGYGEPSQQEYLNRLDDIASQLYKVRERLGETFKK